MPMQGVQPLADIFPCFLIVSRNRNDGIRNKLYEAIEIVLIRLGKQKGVPRILRNVLKEVLASTVYAASVAMANGWQGLWRDLYFTQHGVDFTRILTDVVG